MALAQHYGLPSNGLDVTSSDDVAVWFATNTYEVDNSTGLAKYSKMKPSDWPADPGGHTDHQNRLAETVVCAFRLKPGTYETKASFDTLFPSPDADPAYHLMLQFADAHKSSWGKFINKFHPI
ncbi:FRG domain protein [compost metagenome]